MVIARLKDGVTLAQAQGDMTRVQPADDDVSKLRHRLDA
jgi:hypothetical protein